MVERTRRGWRRGRPPALVALGLLWLTGSAGAQPTTEDARERIREILTPHAHPIGLSDAGRLTGPGADLLLEAAHSAQFFVIGEPHNVREVPRFTAALLDALRDRAGFRYLALEHGPLILSMLADSARGGGREAAMRAAARHPKALHFWTDPEVEMVVRAALTSRSVARPVWGLDQERGGRHALALLRDLAPEALRPRIAGLDRRAAEAEGAQADGVGAIAEPWFGPALDSLEAAWGPASGSRAARIFEALHTSHQIFRQRGGLGIYHSNRRRERYMKGRLVAGLAEAAGGEAGASVPRVVLKFGHWHASRGRSPGEVYTLGNFAAELAAARGLESFHIAVYLLGDVWTLQDFPDYAPLADLGEADGWTLVDLRPLKPHLGVGDLEAPTPELRDVILGYDAVLLMGGAARATNHELLKLTPAGGRSRGGSASPTRERTATADIRTDWRRGRKEPA